MIQTLRNSIYRLLPVQYRFSRIYHKNRWKNAESRSGDGSTLRNTQNIRNFLEDTIHAYEISSITDIACGDINWMSKIFETHDIRYAGFDIVPELIAENKRKYGSERVTFDVFNAIRNVPPKADLAIFRDCMLHLSLADGVAALKNIKASGTPLVLMSTWPSAAENRDIPSGHFRPVDMCRAPFNLPAPLAQITENEPGKSAALWCPADWAI